MHHSVILFLVMWIICDTLNWGMVSGFLRSYTTDNEPFFRDRVLVVLCVIFGPAATLPLLLTGCFKHWAWRPETHSEIEQRLMLRKLEE